MKKATAFIWFALLIATLCEGQAFMANGVNHIAVDALHPILINDVVEGYYAIYGKQLIGPKKREYALDVMDFAFHITNELSFFCPDSARIVGTATNGSHFLIASHYGGNGILNIKILSLNGDVTFDTMMSPFKLTSFSGRDPVNFYGVNADGFLMSGNGQPLQRFDNEGHLLWQIKPDPDFPVKSEGSLTFLPFRFSDAFLFFMVHGEGDPALDELSVYNAATGQFLWSINNRSETWYLMPKRVKIENDLIYVTGSYFPSKYDIVFSLKKCEGTYLQVYQLNGQLVSEKLEPWEMQVFPLMDSLAIAPLEKNDFIWIHDIVPAADHQFYTIGEIFTTENSHGVSDLGANVIKKIFVLRYDQDFRLQDMKLFRREKSGELLRDKRLFNFVPTEQYLTLEPHTDYYYTLHDRNFNSFMAVFTSFEHLPKDDVSYVLEAIGLNGDAEITHSELKLNAYPDSYTIIPSKLGYISLVENFVYQHYYAYSQLNMFKFDF